MSKISALLLTLSLMFLGGCSDNDKVADRDKDGVEDALDCDPDNALAWASLRYRYVDRDGDGYVQIEQGKLCTNGELPEGFWFDLMEDVTYGDCDDSLKSGKLVYRSVSIWFDGDGDGYGAGEPVEACIGDEIPKNYVTNDSDCNPQDADRFSIKQYHYRDADQDGYLTYVNSNFVCTGENLPETYYTRSMAEGLPLGDCDDDPVSGRNKYRVAYYYLDSDRDGYGVGENRVGVCTDDSMPIGYSRYNSDCNDQDAYTFKSWFYNYRDKDADTYFVEEAGSICAADTRPVGYSISNNRSLDCDDDPQTGSLVYRIKNTFIDGDGDGYGTGVAEQACVGQLAPQGQSFDGNDCDDSDQLLFRTRKYAYVDADHDRHVVEQSGELCTNGSLPAGYYGSLTAQLSLGDCDDHPETGWDRYRNVMLYADNDEDGYGAGEGAEQCIGSDIPRAYSRRSSDCDDAQSAFFRWVDAYQDADGDNVGAGDAQGVCGSWETLPDGFSFTGSDCAPEDSARWRTALANYKDNDGDGYYARLTEAENLCIGEAPPNNFSLVKPSLLDCDDSEDGQARFQQRTLYQDNDGDGYGVLPLSTHCLGFDLPLGYAMYGIDLDDSDATVTIQSELSAEEWQLIFN